MFPLIHQLVSGGVLPESLVSTTPVTVASTDIKESGSIFLFDGRTPDYLEDSFVWKPAKLNIKVIVYVTTSVCAAGRLGGWGPRPKRLPGPSFFAPKPTRFTLAPPPPYPPPPYSRHHFTHLIFFPFLQIQCQCWMAFPLQTEKPQG
jgi:hypothetical protein